MRISDWSSDVCLPIYSFLLYARPVSEGMRTYLRDQGMTDEDHDWFMTQPVPRRAILGVDYYEWNEKLVDIAGRVQSLGELFGWYVIASRRSEEHTSELQSLMRISYAVFCLKKKKSLVND